MKLSRQKTEWIGTYRVCKTKQTIHNSHMYVHRNKRKHGDKHKVFEGIVSIRRQQ